MMVSSFYSSQAPPQCLQFLKPICPQLMHLSLHGVPGPNPAFILAAVLQWKGSFPGWQTDQPQLLGQLQSFQVEPHSTP